MHHFWREMWPQGVRERAISLSTAVVLLLVVVYSVPVAFDRLPGYSLFLVTGIALLLLGAAHALLDSDPRGWFSKWEWAILGLVFLLIGSGEWASRVSNTGLALLLALGALICSLSLVLHSRSSRAR